MPIHRCLTALAALLLSSEVSAADPAPAAPGFVVVPVGGSVSVLQGFDCNIPASAGDDGIVMVDTCGGKVAAQLLAAVKRLSSKPIRFVVNTHAHGDHMGGDAVFQKYAPVIAHDNGRKWMISGNEITGEKKSSPEALPIVTFAGELTLHLNGDDIRLVSLPPAHTDSDVVVFFKKANVVAMGDVFMSPAASFAEQNTGGSYLGLVSALEFVLPQIPADAKVIPGHGTISTRADVARGLEVLRGMKAVVQSAVSAGKTLQQLTAERPFDKWRSSVPEWASSDKSMDGWVKEFYQEIAPKPRRGNPSGD